jgi:broad specificity phosphatase PhoE
MLHYDINVTGRSALDFMLLPSLIVPTYPIMIVSHGLVLKLSAAMLPQSKLRRSVISFNSSNGCIVKVSFHNDTDIVLHLI